MPSNQTLLDGTLSNGILHGGDGSKPLLLLAPGTLPALPGAQFNLINGSFLRQVSCASSHLIQARQFTIQRLNRGGPGCDPGRRTASVA